jgi:hypothetical protein
MGIDRCQRQQRPPVNINAIAAAILIVLAAILIAGCGATFSYDILNQRATVGFSK